MKVRKIPQRMCVGCREMKPKGELMRIVRSPDGSIIIDEKGKAAGRGAYVCKDKVCLERAYKAKLLQKNLEAEISQQVFEELRSKINE